MARPGAAMHQFFKTATSRHNDVHVIGPALLGILNGMLLRSSPVELANPQKLLRGLWRKSK